MGGESGKAKGTKYIYPEGHCIAELLTYFLSVNDSGAHFFVSNTEFEGGGDGHGHGEGTFWSNKPNPAIAREFRLS
jgi:hypothetical protein